MSHGALQRIGLAVIALSGLLLGACGDGDDGETDASTGTFVAIVEGTDAAIAVVSNGEKAAGYMCDSGDVSVWFVESEVSDGEATLTTRGGEEVGTVNFDGDEARGDVNVSEIDGSFSAKLATGDAGLFRGLPVRGEPTRELGTVVLGDRGQAGTAIPHEQRLLASTEPAAALQPLLAIGWIIRNDGSPIGAVAELSGPLPEAAIDDPFAAGLDYPTVENVLGDDDLSVGARPVPGQPDQETLAGTTFQFGQLGPEDLGS